MILWLQRRDGYRKRQWLRLLSFVLLVSLSAFAAFLLGIWPFVSDNERPGQADRGREPVSIQKYWGRGGIFDRNRKELATTIERVSVYVRSREVDSIKETAAALASALSLDRQTVEKQLVKGGIRVWIAEDITQRQEEAVKKLTGLGIYLQKKEKRYYPYAGHGAHILGFAENGVGLAGLESLYDRLLVKRKKEQLAAGLPLTYQQDLILTLDMKIQKILEEILTEIRRESVSQSVKMKVAGYLLDSKSGALIGGAQVPGFDPNNFSYYTKDVLGNMFFLPIVIPDSFRTFFRDCANFYKINSDVAVARAWSVTQAHPDPGNQLQLITKLGLDNPPAVDFHMAGEDEKRVLGDRLHRSLKQQENMIPEVTTPMNLLVAMSSLLHGIPSRSPYTLAKIVESNTGKELAVPSANPAPEPLNILQDTVQDLFYRSGTKKSQFAYLSGTSLGHFLAEDGSQEFVRGEVVYVDIQAGDHPLALLLVSEIAGYGPFAKFQTLQQRVVEMGKNLERKIGKIGILQMVSRGAEGLLEQETAEYGNYQGKERYVVCDARLSAGKSEQRMWTAKMPDLRGMSLRKSLQLLQGFPVALAINGSGRVVRQSPPSGSELTRESSCSLYLENPNLKALGFK